MAKDVGTQTDNTLLDLLGHDYSLHHTDYSKNLIILESKTCEHFTQIRELKKKRCSLNTNAQELKSIKVFIRKYER